MSRPDGPLNVQELYHDLARKYRNVGTKVDAIWRKFTPKQREEAMRESTGDGKVLRSSRDPGLSGLNRFIPEYNLQDMTSAPEHFLNIFKFRASTPLYDQLYEGVSEGLADRELMEKPGMRYPGVSPEEKTVFLEGEHYGKSFMPGPASGGSFPGLPFEQAKFIIIPRTLGELILIRQQLLFQFLNHIIEEILDLGSETRKTTAPKKHENEALTSAVANLDVRPRPLRSSLPEVLTQASDSKVALEDYLNLLRTEPVVLNQAVNTAYYTRAELVADDRGRILPAFTDRYLSAAFFDSMTTAIKAIAIWDYMFRLLQLLESPIDKVKRGLIMQELSNTCHLEYRRAQESFKRKVAPQFFVAGKRFKRMTDAASGQSKIVMKGQPADCTVSDPQLHYVLRLCHPDTSAATAVQWIQKLDDHNAQYADDRKKLAEPEMEALGDLAIIVSFMHMTSTAIPMAPMSKKSGLLFSARVAELELELNGLKPNADFGDYLIPMDNLLEPQVSTGALAALDEFIVQETGAKLGSLYEDVVQDSLHGLDFMYAEAKARLEKAGKQTTYVPLPEEPPASSTAKLADRRSKEKTRPIGSVYTITAPPETPQIVVTEPVQQFPVKATTVALFSILFSRSEARGSISWRDFEAAMADLGFSVTPKGGSIFEFIPPASMNSRPITLHRPHLSDIEGYKVCIFKRRLERVYGWAAESFVVA